MWDVTLLFKLQDLSDRFTRSSCFRKKDFYLPEKRKILFILLPNGKFDLVTLKRERFWIGLNSLIHLSKGLIRLEKLIILKKWLRLGCLPMLKMVDQADIALGVVRSCLGPYFTMERLDFIGSHPKPSQTCLLALS